MSNEYIDPEAERPVWLLGQMTDEIARGIVGEIAKPNGFLVRTQPDDTYRNERYFLVYKSSNNEVCSKSIEYINHSFVLEGKQDRYYDTLKSVIADCDWLIEPVNAKKASEIAKKLTIITVPPTSEWLYEFEIDRIVAHKILFEFGNSGDYFVRKKPQSQYAMSMKFDRGVICHVLIVTEFEPLLGTPKYTISGFDAQSFSSLSGVVKFFLEGPQIGQHDKENTRLRRPMDRVTAMEVINKYQIDTSMVSSSTAAAETSMAQAAVIPVSVLEEEETSPEDPQRAETTVSPAEVSDWIYGLMELRTIKTILLRFGKIGDFLVSVRPHSQYILSYRYDDDTIKHVKITRYTPRRFMINGEEERYVSISEIIRGIPDIRKPVDRWQAMRVLQAHISDDVISSDPSEQLVRERLDSVELYSPFPVDYSDLDSATGIKQSSFYSFSFMECYDLCTCVTWRPFELQLPKIVSQLWTGPSHDYVQLENMTPPSIYS